MQAARENRLNERTRAAVPRQDGLEPSTTLWATRERSRCSPVPAATDVSFGHSWFSPRAWRVELFWPECASPRPHEWRGQRLRIRSVPERSTSQIIHLDDWPVRQLFRLVAPEKAPTDSVARGPRRSNQAWLTPASWSRA